METGRNFYEELTEESLRIKIWEAWLEKAKQIPYNEIEEDEIRRALETNSRIPWDELAPNIESDIKRRIRYKQGGFSINRVKGMGDAPVGFFKLGHLAFIGIETGGIHEIPFIFIIYWNGQRLRGYIPQNGNTWNTVNRAAYGYDDSPSSMEVDLANILARGWKGVLDVRYRYSSILDDIQRSILYRPELKPPPLYKVPYRDFW